MTTSSQWAEYIPSSSPADVEPDPSPHQAVAETARTDESGPDDLGGGLTDGGHEHSVDDGLPQQRVGTDPVAASAEPPAASPAAAEGKHTSVGEYTAMPGIPGRGICLLAVVSVGGCAGVDVALTRGITTFFDLCFVTVCLVASMAVRRRDLFTTGVLPPLVFAAVVGVVAVLSPATFVEFGGVSTAFMSGLAQHASGLVAGYGVALLTVASRVSASRVR